MMDIEELNGQSWYLAQYITGGTNREKLFRWLSEQHITPWTPLTIRTIRRTDKINCIRKRISPALLQKFGGNKLIITFLLTEPQRPAFCVTQDHN
jgi:hypothetical protein